MAHVPIGRQYTSEVEGEVAVDFVCMKCDHRATAVVRSQGEGQKTAYLWIGTSKAKEGAQASARAAAERNARVVAAQAACPECGFADQQAAALTKQSALFKLAAMVGGGVLLGWLMANGSRGTPASTLIIPVALCGAGVWLYLKSSWQWTEVAQRVRFIEAGQGETRAGRSKQKFALGFVWGETLQEAGVTFDFAKGLKLGLLMLEKDGQSWADPGDLEDEAPEDARVRAAAQLGKRSQSLVKVQPGIYRGRWDDGLSASRLLVRDFFKKLDVGGRPIAFTPTEDTLLVAGSDDETALGRALTEAEKDVERVLGDEDSPAGRFTANPWVLGEAGWEPWQVPETHPLRERIQSLEARLGKRAWRPATR